jgi:hypothetical protein
MVRILLLTFVVVPALSFAQQQPVNLSSFSPTLKLDSVMPDGSVARFSGSVTVTGTIYFEFDQGDSGHRI